MISAPVRYLTEGSQLVPSSGFGLGRPSGAYACGMPRLTLSVSGYGIWLEQINTWRLSM